MLKRIFEGKDANLKELLSGSALTFVLKLSGIILTYLLYYIINLKNGAEGIGTYNLFIQAITVVGMLVCLGTNTSILKYAGQYHAAADHPKLSSIYYELTKYILLLCILIAGILFFAAPFWGYLLGKNGLYTPLIKNIAIILPFFALNLISIELFRGIGLLKYSEFYRSVITPISVILLYLIFWKRNLTSAEITYLFISATIFSTITSAIILRYSLTAPPKKQTKFLGISQILTTSIPMMVSGTMSTLLTAFPIFFLDFFGSKQDVGVFSLNFKISQGIILVLMIVNTILAPKIAFYYHSGKKNELQKLLHQSSKLMFWVAFLLTIMLIVCGKFVLSFFGAAYTSSYWQLIILVIGNFINVASGSVGIFMNMSGNQKQLIKLRLANLIVCFGAYWFFTPRYGGIAVSLITSLEVILFNVLTASYIQRKLQYITYYLPFLEKMSAKKSA
ncbi:MAG: oligosaccharide flippase family protein [Sphingobacteriaceae bacterium]|nr:oligosaccharide flippase family protein [Sphingobacteriaceae bacterium]